MPAYARQCQPMPAYAGSHVAGIIIRAFQLVPDSDQMGQPAALAAPRRTPHGAAT